MFRVLYFHSLKENQKQRLSTNYAKNNNGLNVNLLQFDQTQRFSGSKQYLKLIDYDVYV
jgi:hypothetical protein